MRSMTVPLVAAVLAASAASAHDEPMELDALLAKFGWDLDTAEITTEKVADGLYVLFGVGGNIGVSVGPQGVLIVDDQFPELTAKIGDAIRQIGGGAVDFAINTHWHFDHADGNQTLGPGGTWLVSQANSRQMMLDDHIVNLVSVSYLQKAYPVTALPVITYDTSMQFHFNGERIELMHFGAAHTTGDSAVIFRGSNAVHLGDVFNNAGFPFIDVDNGGDLAGTISFCRAVLNAIDEDTIVIPGHGPISDYQGLVTYVEMLTDMHETLSRMVNRGRTLEQVIAANPTAKWEPQFGTSTYFVDRAYASVKRELGR